MRVYFLRHGIAAERDEWRGDDAARPLTEKGVERTGAVAAGLAGLGVDVGAIVTSPLARARQTADIVAHALGGAPKVVEDRRLAPGFDAAKLREILRDHRDAGDVMLVGHEPDLSETIGALTGGGRVVMRKAGLAVVDLPNAHEERGELLWLAPPKILTRLKTPRR